MTRALKATILVEELRSGGISLSVQHPRHGGQWMRIKVAPGGSSSIVKRAVKAVYDEQAGDADCYLEAAGMSDAEAFSATTWR